MEIDWPVHVIRTVRWRQTRLQTRKRCVELIEIVIERHGLGASASRLAPSRLGVAHLRLGTMRRPCLRRGVHRLLCPFSSEKLFHAVNHHLWLEWFREHVAR